MLNEERWVNVEEVAAHLAVGRDSVYRWIEAKGLPAHRVGRLYRFRISEIDEWVRKGDASDRKSPPLRSGQRVDGRARREGMRRSAKR